MYKVLELFAGGGGLALGLKKAGLNTIALVEYDPKAAATLRMNFLNTKVLEWNLCGIDPKVLWEEVGDIDILTGGVPCQAFSMINIEYKRLGLKCEKGKLFFDFINILTFFQPKMFMIENVKTLLTHPDYNYIKNLLEGAGYNVFHNVLNANNYDVPQKRMRAFIGGVRKDLSRIAFEYPQPCEYKPTINDISFCSEDAPSALMSESRRLRYLPLFEALQPGQTGRDLPPNLLEYYYTLKKAARYHEGNKYIKRARLEEPSNTVIVAGHGFPFVYIHPIYNRTFTTYEIAAIQSFPSDYIFEGGKCAMHKQIGNAVPPNLGYHIGLAIRKHLDKIL